MYSTVKLLGQSCFPSFSGIRILMMPIRLDNLQHTIPSFLDKWRNFLNHFLNVSLCKEGIAYLTIDEAKVKAGICHRRPGLHVDGWESSEDSGTWGGGDSGFWGKRGMLVASNICGSRAWNQEYTGEPHSYGDCEHLRSQFTEQTAIPLEAYNIYHLDRITVHESIPVVEDCQRQFVRLSMPSDGDWYSNCTPNPLGVIPTGRIVAPRPQQFSDYGKIHG